MALAHVRGVPRIGPNRELKFAQEAFWRGEIDAAALKAVGSGIRQPTGSGSMRPDWTSSRWGILRFTTRC